MSLEHLTASRREAALKTKTRTAQCRHYLEWDILNICLHKLAVNLQRQASSFKSLSISLSTAVSHQQHYWHLGLDACMGDCPAHWRKFSSIPDLYPLDTNSIIPLLPSCDKQKCANCLGGSGWERGQNFLPILRATALEKLSKWLTK